MKPMLLTSHAPSRPALRTSIENRRPTVRIAGGLRCRASLNGNGSATAATEDVGGPNYVTVQRNLALELVRVTEAAALAGGRWLGRGDKNAADQAAVDQMRKVLNNIEMDGVIVIGEGEKDEAPMLYCGEHIGTAPEPKVDIAVDPLDGTSLVAQGRDGAISVIAMAERGALFDPGPCMCGPVKFSADLIWPRAAICPAACCHDYSTGIRYMEKLAVGPAVNPRAVSLNKPIASNIRAVAEAKGKPVGDVTVVILDRPRHKDIIQECRDIGCRIRLISDGDVAAAVEVAKAGSAADIMFGIGGTPEGVIAACALRCLGGSIQGRLWPRDEDERQRAIDAGYDLDKILHTAGVQILEVEETTYADAADLCTGKRVFFAATGISDGDLVRGVRYFAGGATTNSIVMRSESGTVRVIETQHRWNSPSITNINDPDHSDAHQDQPQFSPRMASGGVGGRLVQW